MEKVYIDYFEEEPCKDCNAIENCKSLGIECTVREHYIDAMPKKEAIEVMAKAIFNKCYDYRYKWEVANEETKTVFRLYAREALNALLKGGK